MKPNFTPVGGYYRTSDNNTPLDWFVEAVNLLNQIAEYLNTHELSPLSPKKPKAQQGSYLNAHCPICDMRFRMPLASHLPPEAVTEAEKRIAWKAEHKNHSKKPKPRRNPKSTKRT